MQQYTYVNGYGQWIVAGDQSCELTPPGRDCEKVVFYVVALDSKALWIGYPQLSNGGNQNNITTNIKEWKFSMKSLDLKAFELLTQHLETYFTFIITFHENSHM